ncbi:unnamed protein product [Macrosiphum euphorbiae]|uniref:Uncharacterized protein n=1 Tax=Macrosiphum euphorbiae TaxID=13131 RepID=A0AAV0XDY8_9HEMI|nr:unnamed protein product [Macrosiphum euphorbiae]
MAGPTVIDWAPARATDIPPAQPAAAVAVPSPARRAHAAGPSHDASTTPRLASTARPAIAPVITGISGASDRTFDRDKECPPPTTLSHQCTENSGRNIKRKKVRLQSVNALGFIELQSTFKP